MVGSGGLDREAAQVQFSLVGKYSIVFSGKRLSRASLFQIKVGQEREVLGCDDLSLHKTHLSALLQLPEPCNSLEQLEHLLMPMQASWVCLYSWHFTHLIGMHKSLCMFTRWSSTWIQPVRSWLTASGLVHATFRVAVAWLGDLLSGCLHQDTEAIKPSAKSFSCSMFCRWSLLLGSNWPWQGTKQKIMKKVWGQIHAFRLISVRRKVFLSHSLTKLSLEAVDLNSSSRAGLLKIDMLWIVQDMGGGSLLSGVTMQLSIQLLKSWWSSHCASINFVCALFSSRGLYSMRSCFDVRETHWRIRGVGGDDELWEHRSDAGWIVSEGEGFAVDNGGHAELARPPDDDTWLSFSEDSERDLVRLLFCLIKSCKERSLMALCLDVALRKLLAEVIESLSLLIGLLILLANLSINLSAIEDARTSSAWSQIK